MKEKQKKGKRSRKWIILLIIIALAAVAVTAIAIYQKNNIQALTYANKYSGEELEQKNLEVDSKINEIVEKLPEINVQPLTDEERKKLISGEMSREEALAIITGRSESTDNGQTGDKKPTAGSQNMNAINDLIAEFYLLKAEYLNSIDGLIAEGKSEWWSAPAKNRTLTFKLTLAEKYLAKGNQLEVECDQKINTLLKKLETELKSAGQSTSIIFEITSLYNEEKAVKKAALIERYYPEI